MLAVATLKPVTWMHQAAKACVRCGGRARIGAGAPDAPIASKHGAPQESLGYLVARRPSPEPKGLPRSSVRRTSLACLGLD